MPSSQPHVWVIVACPLPRFGGSSSVRDAAHISFPKRLYLVTSMGLPYSDYGYNEIKPNTMKYK